jgi:hypothetical protein
MYDLRSPTPLNSSFKIRNVNFRLTKDFQRTQQESVLSSNRSIVKLQHPHSEYQTKIAVIKRPAFVVTVFKNVRAIKCSLAVCPINLLPQTKPLKHE